MLASVSAQEVFIQEPLSDVSPEFSFQRNVYFNKATQEVRNSLNNHYVKEGRVWSGALNGVHFVFAALDVPGNDPSVCVTKRSRESASLSARLCGL